MTIQLQGAVITLNPDEQILEIIFLKVRKTNLGMSDDQVTPSTSQVRCHRI